MFELIMGCWLARAAIILAFNQVLHLQFLFLSMATGGSWYFMAEVSAREE
jgi:hypothetical protein